MGKVSEFLWVLLIIGMTMFVLSLLYSSYIDDKFFDETKRGKLQQICQYPTMQSCEDLEYAARYCQSAMKEACKRCGLTCEIVSRTLEP